MANSQNQYQGDAIKVLTVCSAGLLRSPTLAKHLGEEYGYNTRAVGLSEDFALVVLDDLMLHWADEIVFVEPRLYHNFLVKFPLYEKSDDDDFIEKNIKVLNIPDNFSWNEPSLVKILKEQYAEAKYIN